MSKNKKAILYFILSLSILPIPLRLLMDMVNTFIINILNASFFFTEEQLDTYTFAIIYSLCAILILKMYSKELKDNFLKFPNVVEYFKKICILGLIFICINHLSTILLSYCHLTTTSNQEDIKYLLQGDFFIALLPIIILAPAIEEIIFRYIIQNWLKNRFGVFISILITSLLFGLWHYGGGPIFTIIPYCLVGLYPSFVYHRTNNITLSIGVHMFNNMAIIVIAFIMAILYTSLGWDF